MAAKNGNTSRRILLKGWRSLGLVAVVAMLAVMSIGAVQPPPGRLYDTFSERFLAKVGMSFLNQRFNRTTAISSHTIDRLGTMPAWSYVTDEKVTHIPIEYRGRVYFADWAGNVYCLLARTGQLLWKTHAEDPTMGPGWNWYGFAGTGTIADGMLLEASVDGKAFALDLKTGEVIWETSFTDQPLAGSISKIMTYNGVLYIGMSSVDEPYSAAHDDYVPESRGGLVALDVQTGEHLWTTYTVPPEATGGAVWGVISAIPDLNLVVYGTGNFYLPPPDEAIDASMTDSVVAVDATTGEVQWYHQAREADVWIPPQPLGPDYDFSVGAQPFQAMVDGKMKWMVGSGAKSGEYHGLDAATGELMWTVQVGEGGLEGGMMGATAIGNGEIVAWSNNAFSPEVEPTEHPISVKGMDPATGEVLWSAAETQPAAMWPSGYMANDVFFVGSLTGDLKGYDAHTGEILWSATAPGAVGASVLVSQNRLYVPVGLPMGKPGTGVAAYKLQPQMP